MDGPIVYRMVYLTIHRCISRRRYDTVKRRESDKGQRVKETFRRIYDRFAHSFLTSWQFLLVSFVSFCFCLCFVKIEQWFGWYNHNVLLFDWTMFFAFNIMKNQLMPKEKFLG